MRSSPLGPAALALAIALAACTSEVTEMTASPTPASSSSFALTSSAFGEGDAIPREFTCDGANVSPPLSWTGVPSGTEALVLVVHDPDARDYVHWIVFDLDGADGELPRGVASTAPSPKQGRNDFGDVGWGGPCPPSGSHRYRFTLTALGSPLGRDDHPGGDAVRDALGRATILGQVTLTATYSRA
jgi:Raf kinase inhibitor-like YbhB/YbcL family protein